MGGSGSLEKCDIPYQKGEVVLDTIYVVVSF